MRKVIAYIVVNDFRLFNKITNKYLSSKLY